MYVSGRGTNGFGTIFPAIFNWIKRHNRPDIEVCCVCSSLGGANACLAKATELAERIKLDVSVEVYPDSENHDVDYKKLLHEKSIGAVVIVATPDPLHYEMVATCLELSCHVLCVKPLVPSCREHLSLIDLAESHNCYGAVEFHKRWDKANLLIADALKEKKLGKLLYSRVEYSQKKLIPLQQFKHWAHQTSIFQYLGIHYVDLTAFITGYDPVRVSATGQKKFLCQHGIETYDAMQVSIVWKSADGDEFVQGYFVNWVDPNESSAMSDQKILFVGTQGRFESDQKCRGSQLVIDGEGVNDINPDFCMPFSLDDSTLEWRGYGIDSVTSFLSDVCDIETGKVTVEALSKKRPSFSTTLMSTAVVEAAHDSLKLNSQWINISRARNV